MIFAPIRHARLMLAPFGVLSALLLSSCAHPSDVAPNTPVLELTSPRTGESDPTRINGRVTPGSGTVASPFIRQDGTGRAVANPEPRTNVTADGDISLNYVDADIREVIRL